MQSVFDNQSHHNQMLLRILCFRSDENNLRFDFNPSKNQNQPLQASQYQEILSHTLCIDIQLLLQLHLKNHL
jgi:hypothetical protein